MSTATNELYQLWKANATQDEDLVKELAAIEGNEDEIYERFYKELEFGTAGLRGIIGAGCNRMNIYTVARTTQGLANYLNEKYENPSVAIAYDSRIKADVFAKECAAVLAANGVKAFISTELQPTPVLSFAVRELKCQAGIMITASHNPAKYNGYKCYGSDGCQMTDVDANIVYDEIQKVDIFNDIKKVDFEEGLKSGMITFIEDSLYETYLDNVQAQAINPGLCEGSTFKIVYTPLNGAGNKLVRKVLSRIGIKDVIVVPEQELPDGNFPTCPSPNPEIREALELAIALADKENADLILATDPDSDRVGIAVKNKDGSLRLFTGNETGIMLTNYILSCRKANGTLPEKPVAVKTIVSSVLVEKICERFGCELKNVLTGFKYIGDQILRLEKKNEEYRYVFGFEESYGYLAGTYVRDKDAVVGSMLICEMAAYYAKQGKTLCDVIDGLYEEYGYFKNTTLNFAFEGAAGMDKMQSLMNNLRENPLKEVAGIKVIKTVDYKASEAIDLLTGEKTILDLPKSNVLEYGLEGDCKLIIRPSGTEPKIKAYVTAVGKTSEEADACTKVLVEAAGQIIS
ncbi:MAG: phospho-sugar mutase [Clostridia bacterium]|nr:phospho-sugar mutase [Clostridia bacterium]